MQKAITSVSISILATILLAACAVNPIQQDQTIVLGKNQGLAAIAFNMPEPIENIFIVPADGKGSKSGKLLIDNVPKGESIYLFVVPAGKYCLDKFTSYSKATNYHSIGHAGLCFKVTAGKLSYSGQIGPYEIYGKFVMLAKNDPATFHALLKNRYPKIAAQFLPAE